MARSRRFTGCFLTGAALTTSDCVRPRDTGPSACPDSGDPLAQDVASKDRITVRTWPDEWVCEGHDGHRTGDGSALRAPALCTSGCEGTSYERRRRRRAPDCRGRRPADRTGAAAGTVATVAGILAVWEALSPNVNPGSSASAIAQEASLILAEMGGVGMKYAFNGEVWAIGRRGGASACWSTNPPKGYRGCECNGEDLEAGC